MITEPSQAKERLATMHSTDRFIMGKLRLAGVLIIAGVLVQGLTLVWNHPLSFMAFVGIGGLAVFAGSVVYLLALVSPSQS